MLTDERAAFKACGLSQRTTSALLNENYSVSDLPALWAMSDQELRRIPGIGKGALSEIRAGKLAHPPTR